MSHFMPYQKVIYRVRGSLPDGEDESPTINIETGSANLTMLYLKILRSEQFGESAFDFLSVHPSLLVTL
jgi:hypothetical protein